MGADGDYCAYLVRKRRAIMRALVGFAACLLLASADLRWLWVLHPRFDLLVAVGMAGLIVVGIVALGSVRRYRREVCS